MKKTDKPTPKPCPCCGRVPVIVSIRRWHWRVACPYLDCKPLDAFGESEAAAVENWNKEVAKK